VEFNDAMIGSTNRNLSMMIVAVIGVSVLGGGWYLIQIQGEKADFSIPDIDGNIVTLSDYSDEIVVLDFMATWCGPCRFAMQDLVSVQNEIGDQFVLMSISVDPNFDTIQVLKEWRENYEAMWIHARDIADPPVTQQFNIREIPTYVILDRDGEIRFTHVGPVSALKLKTEILSLVNE
jgi:cytochrome oxidase Cu insertion factor (SCO1/SenC/PrrC family)